MPARNSTSSSTWRWSSTSRTSGCYIARCAEMVKPDGIMFVATINRTLKALGLAIIGAEYVLRWLPRGTHQYRPAGPAGRAGEGAWRCRHDDRRPHRRRLPPARRPLAAVQGHGRQLYGAGAERTRRTAGRIGDILQYRRPRHGTRRP